MKKISTLFFLAGLALLETQLTTPVQAQLFSNDSGYYLPPRGYVVPNPGSGGAARPQPQVQAQPQRQAPRYPRQEAYNTDRPPVVKKTLAPVTTKKKPVVAAAQPKSTPKPVAKIAKVEPKKSLPAKKVPQKAVVSTKPKKSPRLDEVPDKVSSVRESLADARISARKIKDEAKRSVAKATQSVKLNPSSEVADVVKTKPAATLAKAVEVENPVSPAPAASVASSTQAPASTGGPSIITQADRLPSHILASASMLPLATYDRGTSLSAPTAAPAPAIPSPAKAPLVEISSNVTPKEIKSSAATPAPAVASAKGMPTVEKAVSPKLQTETLAAPAPTPVVVKADPPAPKIDVKELNKPSAPKAAVINDIPLKALAEESSLIEQGPTGQLAEIDITEPAAAKELPPVRRPVKVETAPSVAVATTQAGEPLPPMKTIRPSMASVQRAEFRPSASSAVSSDFIPGGTGVPFMEAPAPKPAAPAFTLNPSLGTMTIDAERADSQSNKNLVTFNGNVEINCKRFQMKADKVVTNLRSQELGGGIEKVVGTGNVTVKMLADDAPGYLATGSYAVYDPVKQTLRITGWPKIEESNKSLVASSAGTEFLIDTTTSQLSTTGSTKTVIKQ